VGLPPKLEQREEDVVFELAKGSLRHGQATDGRSPNIQC
jgi:hypothetical protein